jgi:transposase-like protein
MSMARAFSKDPRERIVNAYNSGVGTISQEANLFDISK